MLTEKFLTGRRVAAIGSRLRRARTFAGFGAISVLAILLGAAEIARAAAASSEFNELLAAARKEKELLLYNLVPSTDQTLNLLEKAFAKRFQLDVAIKRVPLVNQRALARYITEAKAGRFEADVLYATPRDIATLKELGYVSRYDWVQVFGRELRDIKRAHDDVKIPELLGTALNISHNPFAFSYNTKLLPPDKVPTSYEDLTRPEWRGKFALNPTGVPLIYLVSALGLDKTIDLARRLYANSPLMVSAVTEHSGVVERGEVLVAPDVVRLALVSKDKGAPIDLAFPKQIASGYLHYVVMDKAPRRNLARLFTAWVTTEGLKILEAQENFPMYYPGFKAFELIKKKAPEDFVISVATDLDTVEKELKVQDEVRKWVK
jgi:ABC-type Fe3+ transport system substrate-binding protein